MAFVSRSTSAAESVSPGPAHFREASPSPNPLSTRPAPPSRPPPMLSTLPSFSSPSLLSSLILPHPACTAFLPHAWQPDICRECGQSRTSHTLIQSTSPRRFQPHPAPPTYVKTSSLPPSFPASFPPPIPPTPVRSDGAASHIAPRFNPLTYGQIPTFHLSHPPASTLNSPTFDPPPPSSTSFSSPTSPRLKLSTAPDLSAFAAAVAAAAERRKTSHVPPPLPPHLVAMMMGQRPESALSPSSPPKPPLPQPLPPIPRSQSSSATPTQLPPAPVKRPSNASSPIARLADYFLVIGRGAPMLQRPEGSGGGGGGGDVGGSGGAGGVGGDGGASVPSLFSLRFHPVVLPGQRYPVVDWAETPLSTTINLFAFPSFHSLLLLPVSNSSDLSRRPRFHTFVLTKVNGQKQFGSCLTFFERVSEKEKAELIDDVVRAHTAQLNKQRAAAVRAREERPVDASKAPEPLAEVDEEEVQEAVQSQLESHVLFQPKCLCILSMWPFFSLFSAFLKALFRVSCVSQASSSSAALSGDSRPSPILSFPIPFERYILNFVAEIPVPPPGLLRLRSILPDSTLVSYARPAHNRLPLCDSDYRSLFRVLDVDNVIRVFTCLCTEQKTLLVSSSYSLLTTVAECLTSLLFPFFWSSIYMPFVPEQMLDFLHAPVPFFSGVHSSVTESAAFFFPDDTVVVYLDRNEVVVPDDKKIVGLGEKDHRKLAAHLKRYGVVSSKVLDVDVNVSDWAYPHGEDLQQIRLDEEEEAPSRPETPVSSVNSLLSSWSPRSPSPSASMSPSTTHGRSLSVFSAPTSVPQTPSKSIAHSVFSFNSPTQSGSSTPSGLGSPTSAGPGEQEKQRKKGTSGNGVLTLSTSSTFSAEEVRYAFLRVFVKSPHMHKQTQPTLTACHYHSSPHPLLSLSCLGYLPGQHQHLSPKPLKRAVAPLFTLLCSLMPLASVAAAVGAVLCLS